MKSLLNLGLALALLVVGSVGFADSETNTQTVKKTHKKHASVTSRTKNKKKHAAKAATKNVSKASAPKAGQVRKSEVASGAKLSTDISFNDSTLHGRYQTPDEASVKVENEKVLRDLLAVRTNFKDRLQKSAEQN
jgi:hypothetical protein